VWPDANCRCTTRGGSEPGPAAAPPRCRSFKTAQAKNRCWPATCSLIWGPHSTNCAILLSSYPICHREKLHCYNERIGYDILRCHPSVARQLVEPPEENARPGRGRRRRNREVFCE